MTHDAELLERVLRGTSDANISFSDLCRLLHQLGFDEPTRGGRHVFTRSDMQEILILQPKKAKAKPYQVKQVRNLIVKYHLGGDDEPLPIDNLLE